jgi:hypothetical protein
VAVLASDALGHRHPFFLGLVREHRAAHHVADGPHARQVGAAFVVNHDRAALVELEGPPRPGSAPAVCGTRPIETIKRSTSSVASAPLASM